jgi:hypothetical protein
VKPDGKGELNPGQQDGVHGGSPEL